MLRPLRWFFGLVSPLLLPTAVAVGLTRILPLQWAATAFLATMTSLALVGCLVLQTTAVQQITWRNHVAGRCLPFAQLMGGGTLFQVFLSSVLGSTAVGAFVFLFVWLDQRSALPPWYLAAGWGLDALTLLALAVMQTRLYRHSAPSRKFGRWLFLFVVVQIVASTMLHVSGRSGLAATIAAVPQLLLLVKTGLYFGVVMAAGSKSGWR